MESCKHYRVYLTRECQDLSSVVRGLFSVWDEAQRQKNLKKKRLSILGMEAKRLSCLRKQEFSGKKKLVELEQIAIEHSFI